MHFIRALPKRIAELVGGNPLNALDPATKEIIVTFMLCSNGTRKNRTVPGIPLEMVDIILGFWLNDISQYGLHPISAMKGVFADVPNVRLMGSAILHLGIPRPLRGGGGEWRPNDWDFTMSKEHVVKVTARLVAAFRLTAWKDDYRGLSQLDGLPRPGTMKSGCDGFYITDEPYQYTTGNDDRGGGFAMSFIRTGKLSINLISDGINRDRFDRYDLVQAGINIEPRTGHVFNPSGTPLPAMPFIRAWTFRTVHAAVVVRVLNKLLNASYGAPHINFDFEADTPLPGYTAYNELAITNLKRKRDYVAKEYTSRNDSRLVEYKSRAEKSGVAFRHVIIEKGAVVGGTPMTDVDVNYYAGVILSFWFNYATNGRFQDSEPATELDFGA
jgi:hypothetical protein